MTHTRRFIAVLVLTALMILAFLGGSLSAASSLSPQAQTAGQVNLTPSEWSAVQAGNSLLTSWWSNAANYLPLIIKE
jgi:hypothetical protein